MKKTGKTTLAFKSLLMGLVFSASLAGCKKAEEATSNENALFQNNSNLEVAGSPLTTIPNGSYDLTKSLPSGYVKDGSVDYTSYVQAAINANSNVSFPAFPILVNEKGIIVPSNRTLNFLSGSQLLLKPTSSGNYNLIRIENASNVVLNNPVIVGDVGKHLGSSGEWGNGIVILSSNNISINDGSVTNCWGDGIYLSASSSKITNTKIAITNTVLQYNRRAGISITSVNGLVMESVIAGNTTGTSPMTGINFEPEAATDELQNISLLNCKTEYNGGYGIQIGYSNLYGGSNKTTSISIQNHYDKKSFTAVKVSADIAKRRGSEIINGTLTFSAPFWRQNPNSTITTNLYENNLKLLITKPVIMDVNGTQLSQEQAISNLTYKTRINRGANYSLTF